MTPKTRQRWRLIKVIEWTKARKYQESLPSQPYFYQPYFAATDQMRHNVYIYQRIV